VYKIEYNFYFMEKIMTTPLINQTREFIYKQARLLERQLFCALFEDGPREPVLAALRAYQNPDGGFGNALEPDLRTPASQPLAVERAFFVLDAINAFDDPMVLKACGWLDENSTAEGGIPFALPTLEGYPHSPWMQADNKAAQLNPTASLCTYLMKHHVEHTWVKRASDFCWQVIPGFETDAFHDIMPIIDFLTHTVDNRSEADVQLMRFRKIVETSKGVAMDPGAEGYVKFPIDWAPTPQSYLHSLFTEEILNLHLEALMKNQQSDGGWPINWVALSPAAEAEWRGARTIDALNTLKAYGML
jgi:hypothetical protein